MSITGRLVPGRLAQRGATGPWGSGDVIPTNGQTGATGASVFVNESSALSIIAVMACVRLLAGAVSNLPLDSFTMGAGSRKEVTPKPALIAEPWAELSLQAWLSQVMVSLVLRGNFFGLVAERDRLAYPTQIMPLHPDVVSVRRDRTSGRLVYRVGGEIVPTSDVLHIPALMIPGAVAGLNPIEYARQGLGLTIATETFGSQFFANGAHMSGVISVTEDLNPDETLVLARGMAASHSGLANSHLPGVLTGGATWTQLSVNPDDAQFLETRRFQTGQIAMMFGVPPHMIGDVDKTTSWGTGIEQQEQGFVVNDLQTWLTSVESGLSRIRPPGEYVKFNLAGRLRGVTLERYQAYTLGRSGGWLCVDDIRVKEELEPLPDGLGKDYLQPLNYVPLGSSPTPAAPQNDGAARAETYAEALMAHDEAARHIAMAQKAQADALTTFAQAQMSRADALTASAEAETLREERRATNDRARADAAIRQAEADLAYAQALQSQAEAQMAQAEALMALANRPPEPVIVNIESPPPAEVRVNIEAPPPAEVHMEAPQVTVLPAPARMREIARDRDGNITSIIEADV